MADFEPVQITTTPLDPDAEPERIHVFSIDDTDYFMPATFPPALGLRYLEMVRQHGENAAQAYLLEGALGEEAYQALINCDDVTVEQIEAIGEQVGKRALGPLEGRSRNGRGPSTGSRNGGGTSKRTGGSSTGNRATRRAKT